MGVTRLPVASGACVMPEVSAALDVVESAECKKLPSCKKECTKSSCTIEVGQCAASTRKYLDCLATTGNLTCASPGSGTGLSVESSCTYDPNVCAPGSKRKG